ARSTNHPMQPAFTAWFYQGLAEINPSPDRPGFRHVLLRPQFIDHATLTKVKATHRGITSGWQNRGDHFAWHIELPANTTATAYTPAGTTELTPGSHDI